MNKEIYLESEDKKYRCAIELADACDRFCCPDHSMIILTEERPNGTYVIAQAKDKILETEKDIQIAELKQQLAEKEKEIDEFKRIDEKGHFYDLFEDQRKENRTLIKASEQLLQQLKSQPAEIVEKIRKELGLKLKYKLNDEVSVLKICNQINEVLDTILKEYQK